MLTWKYEIYLHDMLVDNWDTRVFEQLHHTAHPSKQSPVRESTCSTNKSPIVQLQWSSNIWPGLSGLDNGTSVLQWTRIWLTRKPAGHLVLTVWCSRRQHNPRYKSSLSHDDPVIHMQCMCACVCVCVCCSQNKDKVLTNYKCWQINWTDQFAEQGTLKTQQIPTTQFVTAWHRTSSDCS